MQQNRLRGRSLPKEKETMVSPSPSGDKPPPLPDSFFMCSEDECKERQSSGEVSIFESKWPPPTGASAGTTSSLAAAVGKKKQKQASRIIDPHFSMTKYRRSAAGMDQSKRTPPRSLEQLECCLDQLEYILCYQQQPPSSSKTGGKQQQQQQQQPSNFPKQTLTGTVSFVEDRIRAVQVDLTVSQQPSAALQYRIVRCHILILYLLWHVPTYEKRFGSEALSAAWTNYWQERTNATTLHQERDDQILCFMALHQLCAFYVSEKVNDSLSFILDYYRRHVEIHRQQLSLFPKFTWALKLVDLGLMGRPQTIMRRLAELRYSTEDSFAILCHFCMAPAIDFLRLEALDQYNKSFMKGEKVASEEISRLLFFNNADEARQFAHETAGLRWHEDIDKIEFKVGPVNTRDKIHGQRQDSFVFGPSLCSWGHAASPTAQSSAATAWDTPEANPNTEVGNTQPDRKYEGERVDAEGVLIPPPLLLYRILRNCEL
jgi:hypothetical protein